MTERLDTVLALLDAAVSELYAAAEEGPERSLWTAELRVTARCVATVAKAIRGWVGR